VRPGAVESARSLSGPRQTLLALGNLAGHVRVLRLTLANANAAGARPSTPLGEHKPVAVRRNLKAIPVPSLNLLRGHGVPTGIEDQHAAWLPMERRRRRFPVPVGHADWSPDERQAPRNRPGLGGSATAS